MGENQLTDDGELLLRALPDVLSGETRMTEIVMSEWLSDDICLVTGPAHETSDPAETMDFSAAVVQIEVVPTGGNVPDDLSAGTEIHGLPGDLEPTGDAVRRVLQEETDTHVPPIEYVGKHQDTSGILLEVFQTRFEP